MGKRNNINVPAGQGDELNCKKTTLVISKKERKNLLKTTLFCQHIKSSLNKKDKKQTKKTYHHYTCTELHTCFETFVLIIILHSVLQLTKLLYLLLIIIILKRLLTSS